MEETKDQGFDPFLNDEMVPEDDSQSFWDRSIHPKAIPFPSIPITVGWIRLIKNKLLSFNPHFGW